MNLTTVAMVKQWTMEINKIYTGDSLEVLKTLPEETINMCVTSPPYFGLRDYGVNGQIGLEHTPEEYIGKLVKVFREVRRCLKDDGTLWLNIGDSYAGSYRGWGDNKKNSPLQSKASYSKIPNAYKSDTIKPKDLIGIPWMLAFALREDGWYLRQDIIWHKPNPMPESVTDRCTKAHEYLFLLSKSKKYFYDYEAIKENVSTYDEIKRNRDKGKLNRTPGRSEIRGLTRNDYQFKNKRSVWTIATHPFKEAHYATFPEKLIIDCIKAGCPVGGIVIDPFIGSGTTAVVARKLDRNYIGIELNPNNVTMAEKRIFKEIGIFNN